MNAAEADLETIASRLHQALAPDHPGGVRAAVVGLSAARVAGALETLSGSERARIWAQLDPQRQGAVLVECHRAVRKQLIGSMSSAQLTAALQQLDLDDLSDIDDELPPGVIESVVQGMDAQRQQRFEVVRAYPDDSAGGLMNVDTISVRPDLTLTMVLTYLAHIRGQLGRMPEEFDAVSVVDPEGIYLGRLMLADLVSMPLKDRVDDIMDVALAPFDPFASASQVARRFADENIVSAPVVNAGGTLLGRITVDDVLDLVRRQGEHSALAGAGLDEGADTFAPAWLSARQRAVWLGVNLANALIAAAVIGYFDATIERLVALAVLMPVVSSMGGVAGTQSLALVIRGMALDHVNRGNRWHLLRRELAVAVINGALWGCLVGWLANEWFGKPMLGLVFGTAIVINLIAGVAVGTMLPLVLARLRVDAAIAGQALLVAFTDTFGFFIFLGMAAALL